MKNDAIYYSVGALLYCPANKESIVRSISSGKLGSHYSLALCLEDTIADDFVEQAEGIMVRSLKKLHEKILSDKFFIPKIFIRVRESKQISRIMNSLEEAQALVTGFIIPKFIPEVADEYIDEIIAVNDKFKRNIYMMPILESQLMIDLRTRYQLLYDIKDKLKRIEPLVLNIRVGGNDLCKQFGFRRHSNETIYDIKPVASIFSDIVTVFGLEYVISGPVWEYFNGEGWDTGLKAELAGDLLCGFIGKTVIHPNQIEIVHNAYKVRLKDLQDANSVLNWSKSSASLVSGGQAKERMNEYKTHCTWAEKTRVMAQVYGIADERRDIIGNTSE